MDSLNSIDGLVDTLKEFAITNKKPLLGICVGLQMFADVGYEEAETKGLGWISGKVSKLIIKKENLNFRTSVGMKLKLKKKVKYLKT